MIDDQLTASVNSRQFNSHVSFFHLLNHLRVDEAASEKVIAWRPTTENVSVSFDFDWIEKLREFVVIASELIDSPIIKWHRLTSFKARLPRENVNWTL